MNSLSVNCRSVIWDSVMCRDTKYRSIGFFSLEAVKLGECPLTDNVGCCHTICVNSRYYVKFPAWQMVSK